MHTHPNWASLLTLWLQTHHQGQPAVVFCHPTANPDGIAARIERLRKLFPDVSDLVGSEYAILACASHEEALRIMHETPKEDPYTLVWDGERITTHH